MNERSDNTYLSRMYYINWLNTGEAKYQKHSWVGDIFLKSED